MCFGLAGPRQFPGMRGGGIEDAPNMRLTPSLAAPTTDVSSLPVGAPPTDLTGGGDLGGGLGGPGGGGGRGRGRGRLGDEGDPIDMMLRRGLAQFYL